MSISSNTTKEFGKGRRERRPTHPGEVIASGLEALGKTVYAAAPEMGLTRQGLNLVVQEKRGLTAEMALRYATYAGTGFGGARLLMEMQVDVDLWDAQAALAQVLRDIVPAKRPRRPAAGGGAARRNK